MNRRGASPVYFSCSWIDCNGNVIVVIYFSYYIRQLIEIDNVIQAIIYGLKVNLSVAVVAMVNHTAILKQSGGHEKTNFTSECNYGTTNSATKAEVSLFVYYQIIKEQIYGRTESIANYGK